MMDRLDDLGSSPYLYLENTNKLIFCIFYHARMTRCVNN